MLTLIPNILTIFRVLALPILAALFFFIDQKWATWAAVWVFAFAALTDFFDGYLARKWNQITHFGKFLDSIADKLLVAITLFLLSAFDRVEGIWHLCALIILMREFLVSGIREFLGPYKIAVPISQMGRWKATIQMIAMGFLIAGPYGPDVVPYSQEIGKVLLAIATVLTITSGYTYFKVGMGHIKTLDENPDEEQILS